MPLQLLGLVDSIEGKNLHREVLEPVVSVPNRLVGDEDAGHDLRSHQVASVKRTTGVVLEDVVRDPARGGGVRVAVAGVEADQHVRSLVHARPLVDVGREVALQDRLHAGLVVDDGLHLGGQLLQERARLGGRDDPGLVLVGGRVVALATLEVQVEPVEAHAVGLGLRPVDDPGDEQVHRGERGDQRRIVSKGLVAGRECFVNSSILQDSCFGVAGK